MSEGETGVTQKPAEDVPAPMRKVHRQLQRWRIQRRHRERIPEKLWAAAGELAREHGVNQVSRALRLEFKRLKRAAEAGGTKGRKRATPAFVELISPQTLPAGECVLELEAPRGKLRIEFKGMALAELAGISRALWEMLA
jgi:hypothetical protein